MKLNSTVEKKMESNDNENIKTYENISKVIFR